MFARGLFFLTLWFSFKSSHQLGIDVIPAANSDGLVYKDHKSVFIQTDTRFITYKFNISSLNFVENNRELIEAQCPNSMTRLQVFDRANSDANSIYSLPNNYTVFNEQVAEFKPTAFLDLLSLIDHFLRGDCTLLENILQSINNLKKLFNRIAIQDVESFFELLDRSRFQSDVLIVSKLSGYSTPFSPQLFFSEVWKYVQIRYKFSENIAFVEFEIPLFSVVHANLLAVYAKPFIHNGDAYKFNISDARYAVIHTHGSIVYSEKTYQENCHSSLDIYFCLKPKEKQNSCYDKYIRSTIHAFSETCFLKLKNMNMITQIDKDLHFTIFSPLRIEVSQNDLRLTSTVTFSSYIAEQSEFNISTAFFFYDPQGPNKYETFYDEKAGKYTWSHKFPGPNSFTLFFIFAYLIFCLFLYVWANAH